MYTIKIPFEHVRTEVYNTTDEFSHVKLKVNIGFSEPVATWFMENCGYIPEISVSRADFQDSLYYVKVDQAELETKFKLTWY